VDADELEMVRASTRAALTAGDRTAVHDALEQLGWTELLVTEPRAAISTLFEEQGHALAISSALDAVVCAALGREPALDVSVLHPSPGGVANAAARLVGDELVVDGVAWGDPAGERVLVPVGDGVVGVPATALEWSPVTGIDPAAGLRRARGTVDGRAAADEPTPAPSWIPAARRALAHELLGVSRATMAIGVDHVRERHQFGQPLAAFQAVRHRLAHAHVAIQAADGAVAASWDDPRPIASTAAKALAGRAARDTVAAVQQVCGALGFTWEHEFHHYLRRALLLDALYGSADELAREIGTELAATGTVARLGRVVASE